jgi:hypothetical protein
MFIYNEKGAREFAVSHVVMLIKLKTYSPKCTYIIPYYVQTR